MKKSRTPAPLTSRRRFLQASAGVGATLLVGCGDDESPSADVGAPDAGTDTSGDVAADVAADVAHDIQVHDTAPDAADADAADAAAAATAFRFAVITDTHIIDEWYEGPEGNQLDTESMQYTGERLDAVVDRINGLEKPVDLVIHVGDLVHTLAQCRGGSCDLDFQYENRTSIDIAAEKMARLNAPYQICYGNHDYEFDALRREDVHDLFAEKVGAAMPPYGVMEHKDWKFLTLNTYLGATHDNFQDPMNGSLGAEQLEWLEAQLQEGKPTMVFLHQMLTIMERDEVAGRGIHTLLEQYRDNIPWVIAGHTHRWLDLSTPNMPNHMVIGATRYDEDCFVIGETQPNSSEVTLLNETSWVPLQPFAERWEES